MPNKTCVGNSSKAGEGGRQGSFLHREQTFAKGHDDPAFLSPGCFWPNSCGDQLNEMVGQEFACFCKLFLCGERIATRSSPFLHQWVLSQGEAWFLERVAEGLSQQPSPHPHPSNGMVCSPEADVGSNYHTHVAAPISKMLLVPGKGKIPLALCE